MNRSEHAAQWVGSYTEECTKLSKLLVWGCTVAHDNSVAEHMSRLIHRQPIF